MAKQRLARHRYDNGTALCAESRKIKYTAKEAKRHARKSDQPLEAYACRFGPHFHIGHERSETYEAKNYPGLGRIAIKRFT